MENLKYPSDLFFLFIHLAHNHYVLLVSVSTFMQITKAILYSVFHSSLYLLT